MPRICEFYGIAIYIYYREHMPPHFHAMYSGAEAMIGIEQVGLLEGRLPPRALGLVVEWATLHQDELRHVWEQARSLQPLDHIEPLA